MRVEIGWFIVYHDVKGLWLNDNDTWGDYFGAKNFHSLHDATKAAHKAEGDDHAKIILGDCGTAED